MKLSDRDLKLLVILLIAVVIACPILFVLRPYNTKIEDVENHISQLKERQAFLAKLNENRQFYNDSIALLTEERGKIVERYAMDLRDENNVIFLANTERQIPIAMRTLSFSYGEPTVISEATVDSDGNVVEGLSALTGASTVEYVTSYESLKDFLKYILDNPNKMVVTSISADQSDADGSISGVFVLYQYAITGEGRELPPAKIPAMDHGVDNMFGIPLDLAEEMEMEVPEEAAPTE